MPAGATVAESGFPGFEAIAWTGVLAPKGTPPALIEKISSDLRKVTQSASYRVSLGQRGNEPRSSTPKEMADRLRADYEHTHEAIKTMGIKPE